MFGVSYQFYILSIFLKVAQLISQLVEFKINKEH